MAPPAPLNKNDAVEICLFTFIPMELVIDPFGVRYRADGPGFSYERTEFRTRHILTIDPSKVTPNDHLSGRTGAGSTVPPPGFVIRNDQVVGQSVSFIPMIHAPVMRPFFPPFPFSYNMELERDTADRLTSMHWYIRRFPNGAFRLSMEANATNPVAISRYFGVVPAINYWVDFDFAVDRSVTVSGTHDGFPAYDFYFQRKQFHKYDPLAVGASPMSLFGPAPDINVEQQGLP